MRILFFCLLCLLLLLPGPSSRAWGFYGHQRINRMAVFTLPPGMFGFYKSHIEYLTSHAPDPDKRRYAVEGEAACHYIDLDHYGAHPFDSIPISWKAAAAKYSEDSLRSYGIVPWQIERIYYRLVKAFKEENEDLILHYSADLGHYVADAHVPLHTTENYNGQLTNQYGIHGFWESRIPELKADEYDYFVGKAFYIDSPLKTAWGILKASHIAVDSVLRFERNLNTTFPKDLKYSYENRGAVLTKVYSREYADRYDAMIQGQVERRMRESTLLVGSYWYSAWLQAGKPDLDHLEKTANDSLLQVQKQQQLDYEQQKVKATKGHED